jgi:hypothetical protein
MRDEAGVSFAAPLLARLARSGAWIESGCGVCRVVGEDGAAAPADTRHVAEALRNGWLAPVRTQSGMTTLRLTGQGRKIAGRVREIRSDKAVLETRLVGLVDGAPLYAEVNVAESPLSWLRSRAGGEYLSAAEFEAGERLRSDFTRARMTARVTVDWDRPFGSGGGNGVEDASMAALAARDRVAHALTSVGPGLSDVLISVCCFLQGLEDSEKRLQWPRRSAKLVLKFALQRLAAHYGLRVSEGAAD